MWQSIFKGRLFGHPVHPMLVHFPTALFTAGFMFDLAGKILGNPSFYSASFYVILLGLAVGVLAGLFGLVDYIKLVKRPEVFKRANWHAGIQFLVITIFGAIAGVKFQSFPDFQGVSAGQLSVMGLGVALMLVGNYLGGELVFKYKVGFDEQDE